MDLTTTTRVENLILATGTPPAWTTTAIGQLITEVSAAVERYLDRYAQSGVSRTEYLDVEAGQRLFRLRAYPVASMTSVSFDPEQVFGSDTVIDSGDYFSPLYNSSGVLRFPYDLNPPDTATLPDCLKVVYTGGMASSTANFITSYPDIAGAVDKQVAFLYQNRNNLGVSSVSGDAGSISIGAEAWLPQVKVVLDQYRRRSC